MKRAKKPLRSENWFNDRQHPDHSSLYMERYLNYGLTRDELQSGKPIIGIAQTGNDLSPCNRHHLDLAQRLKDGIRSAGGIPMEFPVHPLFEQGKRPTAALDRNLATMGLIETLYGYPIDGVILTTGCDKTTPATLMAAIALDLPAIVYSGGPMLNGWSRQAGQPEQRMGSGATIWSNRERYAKGELDYDGFMESAASSVPSVGHCNTMGTALTMNCLAEILGMSLPGCAAIPAPYKEREQMGYHTGRRIVDMVFEDLKPSDILSQASFKNAVVACSALGGSTNAPVHLQAIANYVKGIEFDIQHFQKYGEDVPLIVNCMPAGQYLGEEFYRAGGVPAVARELLEAEVIDGDVMTVTGKTLAENCQHAPIYHREVIYAYNNPLKTSAGFAVMSGNLFDSALMKKSVISADFRRKYLEDPTKPNCLTVRAIVFEGAEDYRQRINDPALKIDAHCILVVRNCGPIGYPGSAEVVNMLPPDYLVKEGVSVLPTMGDGRQSGTSAAPSILNISPEAAAGGGLALLKTGDMIEINLNHNSVNALVDEEALAARREVLLLPTLVNQTPWQEIYRKTVNPLSEGATMQTDEQYIRIIETHGLPKHSH